MPMISIKFDDKQVGDERIVELSDALVEIVQEATGIREVFVYADSPRIKINVAPIEVFIEMSAHKIQDREMLFKNIVRGVSEWKSTSGFQWPVTVTLTPMDWVFEVGI